MASAQLRQRNARRSLFGVGGRETLASLPVPGDVETEQEEVSTDGRSGDRRDEREQSVHRLEPQPSTDEGASGRRRESGQLRLRGPVAVDPGEVEAEPDRHAHRESSENTVSAANESITARTIVAIVPRLTLGVKSSDVRL